jgi:acyl-CoA reductase-like NAD-dependent aldehyde dehydrogenase
LVERLGGLKVGDPMEDGTEIGPLAKRESLAVLSDQLADAMKGGASVFHGPMSPPGKGFFFRPALVTQVTSEMMIMKEEVFGPILPVAVVTDDEAAIALADSTNFGLGASVWSLDLHRAERMARALQVGAVEEHLGKWMKVQKDLGIV